MAPRELEAEAGDERPLTPLARVGRLAHAVVALGLAATIVLPAIPHDKGGEALQSLVKELKGAGRPVSLSQHWRMYSPNPSRAITLMAATAYDAEGNTRRLEEYVQADEAWSTHWWWTKTRNDIWRYYVATRPNKRNPNRTWYLKGLCVREARRNPDAPPVRIVAESVRRRIHGPAALLQGKPDLGAPQRKTIQMMDCRFRSIVEMIKDDRAQRGNVAEPS